MAKAASAKKGKSKSGGKHPAESASAESEARPAWADELTALDAEYDELPNVPVGTILLEAKELEARFRKYAKDLTSGTRLSTGDGAELGRRRSLLSKAEEAWITAREIAVPSAVHKLRAKAEKRKRELLQGLRYWLEEDLNVASKLDAIREGSGDADLLQDLRSLAALVEEFAEALTRAKLGKDPVAEARALADELEAVVTGRNIGTPLEALALRNRAYWLLRDQMNAIRAAGRYRFVDDPRIANLFLSTQTNQRRRGGGQRKAPPSPVTQ